MTDGPLVAAAIIVTDTASMGDVFQQLRRSLRGRCAWATAADVPAAVRATILDFVDDAEDTVTVVAL